MVWCARVIFFLGLWVAGSLLVAVSPAAEPPAAVPAGDRQDAPRPAVDLFAGIQSGVLAARVIPRNERHVNLLLENKTSQPVVVSIPAALAAVPVMAQFDVMFPWPGAEQDRGREPPQNIGLAPQRQGFPGPGPMNLPGGAPWNLAPGAMFSVPPERVTRVRLTGVCLDHGRPTPHARLPYELQPIEQVTDRPEVAAICFLLGQGGIDQTAAQLAAWHFHGEMSWDDLAALREKSVIGTVPRYTRRQIRSARLAAAEAERLTEQTQPPPSSLSSR